MDLLTSIDELGLSEKSFELHYQVIRRIGELAEEDEEEIESCPSVQHFNQTFTRGLTDKKPLQGWRELFIEGKELKQKLEKKEVEPELDSRSRASDVNFLLPLFLLTKVRTLISNDTENSTESSIQFLRVVTFLRSRTNDAENP